MGLYAATHCGHTVRHTRQRRSGLALRPDLKPENKTMIINFDNIAEETFVGFKGGHGELLTRNYVDGNCKIMKSTLSPGAASGLHTHTGDSEIVYIVSGTATFHCDGLTETATAGQVHYCPEGHSHYMENNTDTDLCYIAIVPRHEVK